MCPLQVQEINWLQMTEIFLALNFSFKNIYVRYKSTDFNES